MTITDFLLARIAENERAVEVAADYAVKHMLGSNLSSALVISDNDGAPLWSSDQILAECASKRAIVAYYAKPPTPNEYDPELLAVLRCLAAVYANHPDYRQEWAL